MTERYCCRGLRPRPACAPHRRHHQRRRDVDAVLRLDLRRAGPQPDRHRLLVLGLVGLPCRPGIFVHLRDRLDRRGAADQRVARGDGRGLGAVRGLHQAADRRGRHRAGLRIRQVLGGHPAPGAGAADRPVYGRAVVARSGVDRGCCRPGSAWTRASGPPSRWPRWRWSRSRSPQRNDSVESAHSVDELLERPYFAEPLRRHDIAPITDGAAAIVLASGDRARELRERPGLDHRFRAPHRDAGPGRPRPDHVAVDDGLRHDSTGRRRRLGRGRRTARAVHPPAADPHRSHRARIVDEGQPVRWCAGRQPDVLGGAGTHRLRRPTHLDGSAQRILAHATSGPVLQQNLVAVMEGRDK